MPLVPRLAASAPKSIGIILPELQTPLPDGFVGDVNATFEQKFLYVAVAQCEAIVEPDPVADDLAWKAVIFVALGVGGGGSCLAAYRGVRLVFEGSSLERLCHGSGRRVNNLTKPDAHIRIQEIVQRVGHAVSSGTRDSARCATVRAA